MNESAAKARRNRNHGLAQTAGTSRPEVDGPTDDGKKKSFSWSDWNSRKRLNAVVSVLMALVLLSYLFFGPSKELPQGKIKQQASDKTPTTTIRRDQVMNSNISLAPTLAPARALKVPYPIFVASFSKSGTTSTFHAFECYLGLDYVAHRYTTSAAKRGEPELIGRCIEQNIRHQRLPFAGCGTNANNHTQTVVWTDTAYVGGENKCYHPNLDALDAIWEAYPHATLLLVKRNATAWFHSAKSKRAFFIQKWASQCPQMPRGRNESTWVDFYHNYTQRLRDFAAQRKGQMTYVEVELESPDTGRILEEQIGLPASCWQHCQSSFAGEKCKDVQKHQQQRQAA